MELIVTATYDQMSRTAADVLGQTLAQKPGQAVLGLATGTTPIGLYAALVEDYRAGKVSFAGATTFNLDEYCGLTPDHPQSYRHFMQVNLFDHVDVEPSRTHVPDVAIADDEEASAAYEGAIEAAGGIDVQLLGIGHNGHIGFNEPAEDFSTRTHTVELALRTRQANSRLFDALDQVPTHARTMGIGTIMRARKLLLVASGADKAQILRDALTGPVTPHVPASILQFHPDVVVVADAEAASLLG